MDSTNEVVTQYQKKQECSLAIVSIICGGLTFIFGFLTIIPAIICGHMALGDIKRNPDKYNSSAKTLAIVGVLGYFSIVLTLLIILAIYTFIMSSFTGAY